jgi:IclR family transcriptional regulator, acetate operon repressor
MVKRRTNTSVRIVDMASNAPSSRQENAASADDRDGKNVRAVERAIEILQCFSPDKPWMSVLEIQQRVPLSRPTLYRLLQTLTAKGLVRIQGEPQRFALDFGIGRLAHSWIAGIDAIALARPILERLRNETGETTALFVRRGDLRQCVAELVSPHVLAISRGLGEADHLWRGASGKAILAFMRDDEIAAVTRAMPKSMDKAALLADLSRVRKDGFFISRGEVFVGAIAIAAPYFDHTGQVAGSIGVFGPQARLDKEWSAQTASSVAKSAAELSAASGHAAPSGKR